jgi:hypothetical protein
MPIHCHFGLVRLRGQRCKFPVDAALTRSHGKSHEVADSNSERDELAPVNSLKQRWPIS